jgi:hypothetical protein
MEAGGQDAKPWEQQRHESAAAFAAFLIYLGLGAERTFIAVARQLGRHKSLVYRWARRHCWADRAYQWDLTRARETEAVVRQEREEALRRQLRDADRMQRLSMARVSSMVFRDDQTGQITIAPDVTVADAVRLYRLALQIQRDQPPVPQQPGNGPAADDVLDSLSDVELQQLITLAQERAGEPPQEEMR